MNKMAKASERDSAREMAVATAGVRRAPNVALATSTGSCCAATRSANPLAHVMRLTIASGVAQSAASSSQPLGDGAPNGRCPNRFIGPAISVNSAGTRPLARQLEIRNSYGVLNLRED